MDCRIQVEQNWISYPPSFSISIYLKRKEKGFFWLSVNNSFRHLRGRNKTSCESLMPINLCVTKREGEWEKNEKKV